MTTHVRDPNLYLNDRNIFDGLKGTRKATAAVLLSLARQRGLVLSELTPQDDLIQYISRLTHSWHDIKAMIDLINTADRREKKTTRTLPFKKTGKELERVLTQIMERQAEARDEVWKIATSGKGKSAAVTIKYRMPDFNKSAMTQLTEHTCHIDLISDNGKINVRYDKQDRAQQLVASVLKFLNDETDLNRESEEIELSTVRSSRLRSEFFTKLIEGIPGFRLLEVSTVRGNNSSLGDKPTSLENRATAALQSAIKSTIKKVVFSGRSITGTNEYRQFFGKPGAEPNFHITSIAWVSDEVEHGRLRAEFEASFSTQATCAGFVYRVRKVWYRAADGVLRRGGVSPQPEDERRLMDLVEVRARAVCREIKIAAGVES